MNAERRAMPAVGSVWRPILGRARPKVVVSVTDKGTVYAAAYPRRFGVLPTGFARRAWWLWVSHYHARPDNAP